MIGYGKESNIVLGALLGVGGADIAQSVGGIKYECALLNAFETGSGARSGIGSWIDYYNRRRPHSTFDGRTRDEVYAMAEMTVPLAA